MLDGFTPTIVAGNEVIVRLAGRLDDDAADAIVAALDGAWDSPVRLEFSSFGGSLPASRRIVAAIRRHGDCLGVVVDAAESAAAVCWARCHHREMRPWATIRLHYATTGSCDLSYASAERLRREAENLENYNAWLRDQIVAAIGCTPIWADEILEKDAILDRGAALQLGFLDTRRPGVK